MSSKLLTLQPFSLYGLGGGARVLRRLFHGRDIHVNSLGVVSNRDSCNQGPIHEIVVVALPVSRPWQRWLLRSITIWIRDSGLSWFTFWRIQRAAKAINYDILHIVAHGPFCTALLPKGKLCTKGLWVSFHDHYRTCALSRIDARRLWHCSDRRLVISKELGEEYSRDLGAGLNWEVITDGLEEHEILLPNKSRNASVHIYFGGLLHIQYYELFQSLASAIDELAKSGLYYKLVLSYGHIPKFLQGRSFSVEMRPERSDADLLLDISEADILYLPIGLNNPFFSNFSLSTKMIGYLGAPGAIFYHGPIDSAAANLLSKYSCAMISSTTEPGQVADTLHETYLRQLELSSNAKVLAREMFLMQNARARFWNAK